MGRNWSGTKIDPFFFQIATIWAPAYAVGMAFLWYSELKKDARGVAAMSAIMCHASAGIMAGVALCRGCALIIPGFTDSGSGV
eukprot:2858463-Amphidinium_carterae.1